MPSNKRDGLLKKFDAFIFDWDGTLNNMRFFIVMNEGLQRSLGIWNRDVSIKDFDIKDHNLRDRIKQQEAEKEMLAVFYDTFFSYIKPKLSKDTVEVLKKLKKNKKKIAIFSNGARYRIVKELSYLKIMDYFDIVISARGMRVMKPNPSGIRVIVRELGVKPDRTVYIGDMTHDILTAKLAGVHSCGVASGFDSYHKLKSTDPDYIFKNIEDLKKAL